MTDSRSSAQSRRLAELQAEATYAKERFDLYKAKIYGSGQTSATQLRKLQEASLYAEARLRRAERDA
jgi:hypothetical protein